jgi:four helix bundle protein
MSYRELEVWRLAKDLTSDIHRMTLEDLPKLELYEEGSQIRRSIKSVRANLVEGYARKRYPLEFIRFATYALGSCNEATEHLEILWETGSLTNRERYESIRKRLDVLGRKLHRFVSSLETASTKVRETDTETYGSTLSVGFADMPETPPYPPTSDQRPATSDSTDSHLDEREPLDESSR